MAIFLTGSTGYIGAHIAANLLQNFGAPINVLVRAKDAGYSNLDWIRRDPDLEILHGHPEFERMFPAAKSTNA